MSNYQIMNQVGATTDFLMKTFDTTKKGDNGAFDFANTFESEVNELQSFNSYSDDSQGAYNDQFSFDRQDSLESKHYDEPVAKKDEAISHKEPVKQQEKDTHHKKDKVEDKDVDEDKKNSEKTLKEKDADKSDKETNDKDSAEEKDSDSKKSDDSSEKKKKSKGDKATKQEAHKKLNKVSEEVELDKAIEIKNDDTEAKKIVKTKKSVVKGNKHIKVKASDVQGKANKKVATHIENVDENKIKKIDTENIHNRKVVEDVANEELSTNTITTEQVKLDAAQLKKATAVKNKMGSGSKKLVKKRDMMERLEKETGVKIDKMSMEKVKSSPDALAQKTSKELLKSLDTHRGRFDMRTPKHKASEDTELKNSLMNDKPELKLNKLDVAKNLIRNSSTTRLRADSQQSNSNESSSSFSNTFKDNTTMGRSAKTMQQTPTGHSQSARNLSNVQEILANFKTMLRGADLEAKGRLILDFQTNALGQMRMGVQHKGDGIDVSIEVGSDSSRQELMKQKDELSEQLKNLGYKSVNVDISYGEHQQQQDSQQQKMSGNEDIRNVKLAGDDEADLSEILSMA